MRQRTLEFQADRIEAVLAKHKVPGRVSGGLVSPRWVKFNVIPTLGARVSKVKGLAEDGAPLLVRLPSPDVAHLLIAGTTGSGKTALARTIVVSLALNHRRAQLGFVLVDPKGRAFDSLAELPHLLRPVLRQPEEAGQALSDLVEVMLERDWERRCEPRVVVVIDELADLLMSAGSTLRQAQGRVAQALTRLAQRGREAGVHLIAGTQKPASSVVGSLAKANSPALPLRDSAAQVSRCGWWAG